MGKYSELVHALKSFGRRPLEILRSEQKAVSSWNNFSIKKPKNNFKRSFQRKFCKNFRLHGM